MGAPVSPYHAPGFYDRELARGRHRDIVGGRWDETGHLQMVLLKAEGLEPHHRLLDIGCGALRLGCKAVPYLQPGHYWGTDLSAELMARGYDRELAEADRPRLPRDQLVKDPDFAFPGVPPTITHAIAFAVFTHLPLPYLTHALGNLATRFPDLQSLLLTLFLAPDGHTGPFRQPDGVVTHPDRAPWHLTGDGWAPDGRLGGFRLDRRPDRLPRGQVLFRATRALEP